MADCKAVFRMLGSDVSDISLEHINVESKDQLTLEGLANRLIGSSAQSQLVNALNEVEIDSLGRKVKVADLKHEVGEGDKKKSVLSTDLMYNYTYSALKSKYSLPESQDPDYNPKILFLNNFSRTLSSNIDVMFADGTIIVGAEKQSRERLANYMIARNGIYSYYSKHSSKVEIAQLMKEAEKEYNKSYKSEKDFLYHFLTHNSEYVGNAMLYSKIYAQIINLTRPNQHNYTNTADILVSTYANKLPKARNQYMITIQNFKKILEVLNPEEYSKIKDIKLKEYTDADREHIAELFKQINLEQFTCRFVRMDGNNLIIESTVPTLANTNGIATYSQLQELTSFQGTYKGMHIYKRSRPGKTDDFFYLSQQGKSLNSIVQKYYSSIDEIRSRISEIVEKQTFKDAWDTGCRQIKDDYLITQFKSTRTMYPGHIIKLLNIPIPKKSNYSTYLNGNYTLSQFLNTFQGQVTEDLYKRMIDLLDSIESAGIFAHLISDEADADQDLNIRVEKALNTIGKAKADNNYKLYMVTDFKPGEHDVNTIYIIETSENVTDDATYSRPEPIARQINTLAQWFKDKFEVKTEILTTAEFKKINDDPDVVADYKDGVVYLDGQQANSNTQLFEYSALILSAIRNIKPRLYDYMIKTIQSLQFTQDIFTKMSMNSKNKDMSPEQLWDKVLIGQLRAMLKGTQSKEIFDYNVSNELEKTIREIVNDNDSDIKGVYKGKLMTLFQSVLSFKEGDTGLLPSFLKITEMADRGIKNSTDDGALNLTCKI